MTLQLYKLQQLQKARAPERVLLFCNERNKMYRGTTPTYIFTTDEFDLTKATNMYITFADIDKNMIFTKCGEDLIINENSVSVFLEQIETLQLPPKTRIQINWTYQEGSKTKRACSDEFVISTKQNLIDKVI